tara:strand:+ start:3165 stop:3284 length:120 start_codon:yes stop_codon:yes gene_type:complete
MIGFKVKLLLTQEHIAETKKNIEETDTEVSLTNSTNFQE